MGILHPDLLGEREREKDFCKVQCLVGNQLTLESAPIYSGKISTKYVAALLVMISCYFNKKLGIYFLSQGLTVIVKLGFTVIKTTAEKIAFCTVRGLSWKVCPLCH